MERVQSRILSIITLPPELLTKLFKFSRIQGLLDDLNETLDCFRRKIQISLHSDKSTSYFHFSSTIIQFIFVFFFLTNRNFFFQEICSFIITRTNGKISQTKRVKRLRTIDGREDISLKSKLRIIFILRVYLYYVIQ